MTINGKVYSVPEFDYNTICDLDKYGVNLLSGDSPSPFILLRAAVALTTRNVKVAGDELDEEVKANGMDNLAPAMQEVAEVMTNSGFLAALRANAERKAKAAARAEKAALKKAAQEKEAMEAEENPFQAPDKE